MGAPTSFESIHYVEFEPELYLPSTGLAPCVVSLWLEGEGWLSGEWGRGCGEMDVGRGKIVVNVWGKWANTVGINII